MRSISYEKILAALQQGESVSKYDAAGLVPCDQRTAQRTLAKIHKEGKIRISDWRDHYQHKIPVYVFGEGEDAVKPKPIPRLSYLKKYRKKNKEEINKKKRMSRLVKGAYKSRAKHEIFNLIVGRSEDGQ